ncbi:MFS general substrate transporter [Neoconidiobolus thromboides FSU 785]|nr:MFS general substrate transporter [Neoconidiobolus thromboides FSU 785]
MKDNLRAEFGAEEINNVDQKELTIDEVGARRMASIRGIMSRPQLWACYIGLLLITFIVSLEVNLGYGLLTVALNEFKANALTSVISVVTSLMGIILVPLYSKISDFFGRTEIFLISLFIYVIGLILTFSASSFSTFSAGWIFTSIGSTGYETIKAVLMADLTSLANRANLNAADMIPFVMNNWIGTFSATPISENLGWRWGYIIPTILFVPFIFLFFSMMFYLQHKAKRQTNTFVSIKQFGLKKAMKKIYHDIDLVGFALLTVSLLLIMIPLIVAGTLSDGWNTPSMITLIVIGSILFIGLIVWEYKYSKHPLIPIQMLKNKTTLGGVLIAFFIKMDAGLNWQYFYLYFMISRKLDPTSALLLFKGNQVGYLVSVLVSGILIKKLPNFKYLLIAGTVVNCIGLGTMIPARFPHSSDASIHVTQAISGIGQGMIDMSAIIAYQGTVSRKDVAIVTATVQLLRNVATSIGGTIAGAIWTQVVPQLIQRNVEGEIDLTRAMNEIAYVWELPDSQFEQVVSGFGDGQMIISAVSCALGVIGFLIAVFMVKPVDVHNTQKFDENITDENEEVYKD